MLTKDFTTYGIPIPLSRVAESIFEALSPSEAQDFFAAFPECSGKDLGRVQWQFLASELRALPPVTDDIQAAIDRVIDGMDLLGQGKEWSAADAHAAATNARAAAAHAAAWAADATAVGAADAHAAHAAAWAADATAYVADAAYVAAWASDASDASAWPADTAAYVAHAATWAAVSSAEASARATVRHRQRDSLLRLIKEAPVITTQEDNP